VNLHDRPAAVPSKSREPQHDCGKQKILTHFLVPVDPYSKVNTSRTRGQEESAEKPADSPVSPHPVEDEQWISF
jgi:hypothetical protein